MLSIRKSKIKDLETILKIYKIAGNFMKENGNPLQWGDTYPDEELVRDDIEKGISYVIENLGDICAVFVFFTGKEKSYESLIEEKYDYGIIHRVASDASTGGIVKEICKFVRGKVSNIKIDTHQYNIPMQRALEGIGFKKCGIIYLDDESERILYQLKGEV